MIAARSPTQVPTAIRIPWSQDRREQHALKFFTQTSAPQFAGFFDASFWQRTVLQAARREPAIKHALAAVGAIHERLLSSGEAEPIAPDVRDPRMQCALEQCNSAIHELTMQGKRARQPNLRLTLTACLLLVSFEGLQGKPQQAMAHIMQGYNLTRMHMAEGKKTKAHGEESAVDLEFLTIHFTRLASQAKGIMQKELPLIPRPLSATDSAPTDFETCRRQDPRLSSASSTCAYTSLIWRSERTASTIWPSPLQRSSSSFVCRHPTLNTESSQY